MTGPLDQDDLARRLVGEHELDRGEVSRLAEVSVVSARRFWHALGFPAAGSGDRRFVDADLDALRRVVSLVRSGALDETTALALARALGRTGDRLAAWQVQVLIETVVREGGDSLHDPLDAAVAQQAAERLVGMADELEPLLVYAWRRHLNDALHRVLADATPGHDGVVRAVGFADLVDFSGLVRQLSELDLARTVQRFEVLVSDVVTEHGGRVVKTVGDEVLFSTRSAPGAARIALDLVDALCDDPMLPPARIGCAFGPVVSRLGDVFGMTVNRAARLTPLAEPGAVLVDAALADAVAACEDLRVRPLRRRTLRGVGSVVPHTLTRSD